MDELKFVSEDVEKILDDIKKEAKECNGVTGLASGFHNLDRLIGGFQPGLILVAGRPAMGKTAFALNMIQHVAFREKKHVALFSLEMSKEQMIRRLLAYEANLYPRILRNGQNLEAEEWEPLLKAACTIKEAKLYIDDTPALYVDELCKKCRRANMEMHLDLIVIDYLQLLSFEGAVTREQEEEKIVRVLKNLARELGVPIVVLGQVLKSVENREDHRPLLFDLRNKDALVRAADVILFLYRDAYYHFQSKEGELAEIIVAKNRNGYIGTAKLMWTPEYARFENLEEEKKKCEE